MSSAEYAAILMPNSVTSPTSMRFWPAIWAGAGLVGALTVATILLWAHYGSAVFFEMVMAGLAMCF